MAVNGYYGGYPQFRLSGLASGLDTDKIISELMLVERMPLDKLEQKKQLAEWKRDDYRDITNLLRGFKDEYFNLLKQSTNMLSQSSYKAFSVTSTNNSFVTATGTVTASEGNHSISVVNLATADKAVSTSTVTSELQGKIALDDAAVALLSGKKFVLDLDGTTREITIEDFTTVEELVTGLEIAIAEEFGSGKISVGHTGGKITFTAIGGASKIRMFNGYSNNGLEALGFSPGDSNRLDTSRTLEDQADKFAVPLTFNEDGKLAFTINSKTFTFDKTTTISGMMSAINSDVEARVNINFDEVTDKFIITAKQMGAGNNIDIEEMDGNFFSGASGISELNPVTEEGMDAAVFLDGVEIKRSSNNFTVNGITYQLLKAHTDPLHEAETVSVGLDVDGVYDKIASFVNKYNEIISKINSELSEEYDRTYLPLTEEQKDAMGEDEIKKWEEKAKTGLLRNDSLLTNIVYNMRKALYDSIEGVASGISAIGITTGKYYEKGKLIIDETKLKDAIRKDPDGVMNLFCQKSEAVPSYSRDLTFEERSTRYNEQGIVQRLFDIIEDNITTLRDKNGNKGVLLQKAGITGDVSEFDNSIYWQLGDYDKQIDRMYERLIQREENYYKKYAAMEKILSQMNSQSNWLMSQLNMGGW